MFNKTTTATECKTHLYYGTRNAEILCRHWELMTLFTWTLHLWVNAFFSDFTFWNVLWKCFQNTKIKFSPSFCSIIPIQDVPTYSFEHYFNFVFFHKPRLTERLFVQDFLLNFNSICVSSLYTSFIPLCFEAKSKKQPITL